MAPKTTKKGSKMSSERSSLSSSCSESNQPVNDDDFSSNILKKASTKYPSFISSSSFTGKITAIDSKPIGHAATIWLSESAMLSSALLPGSLVSVSLAASSKTFLNGASPLESLEDECARHFGIDIGHSNGSNMGSFFAVAVVFPSCKVLKNGVRLSWSLSCTMGGPDTGRIVFVSPLGSQSISHSVNGVDLCDCTNTEVSRVPMYKCGELYLTFIPSRNGQRLLLDVGSPVDISKKAGHDQFRAGQASSPKTPSPYQSKLNSLGSSQLSLTRCQGSVASISDQFGEIPLDTSAIEKALEDEKTKRLLETSAAWWLCACRLLHGNLVAIPVGPQIGFFQVDYANKLFVQDPMNEGKQGSLPCEIPTYSPVNHVDAAFLIDSKTKLHLSSTSLSMETQDKGDLSLVEDEERFGVSKLGGLSKECAELKQIILDKIHHDADYTGVLLHGPPGTGKTSLAWSCAYDVGVKLFSVNGPEVFSEDYGKSEKELHGVFDEAKKVAPALVFIDELDAIAPTRKDGSEHVSQRMVVTLLKLMDEITTTSVLVIAATNRPDSVDPALRRHGRFDREIEIGVPTREQRLDILLTLLREVNHSLNDTEIQSLVSTTHGFVGADLAALCNRAALTALRRYIKLEGPCNFQASPDQHPLKSDSVDSTTFMVSNLTISPWSDYSLPCRKAAKRSNNFEKLLYLDNDQGDYVMKQEPLLKVTYGDFEKARMEVSPSAMREVMVEVPKVSWEDVGGQDEVKKQLIEAVEWPQKHQNAFEQVGIRPPSGVLMFGPPGCSKTLMARAVASNAGLNFLAVKGPELFSKWVGESEKAVRSLFAKARAAAPSIIFFDEIDGLAVTRGQENDGLSVDDRVSTQLLVELDGLKQRVNVTVIAATNRPDKIDPALLRPGRFDRLLYVGPPSEVDREDIFRIHLRKMLCGSDVSIKVLAHLTEGCTGADISSICREAALVALEENIDISEISMRHFEVAIGRLQPSEVQSYEDLFIDFQRLGVHKDGGVK